MKIRIYNAQILPMVESMAVIKGEIHIEDNVITYVGTGVKKGIKFDKEINAENNLVMPSFKNAHTHSAMTFGRNYSDELKCGEWLNKVIFPMEKKMTEEHVYSLSKIAYLEYIMNGISACFDMYYEPQAMAKLAKEYGFRTVICGALNDYRETIQSIEEAFIKYNSENEFVSYKLGVHAEYTTSKKLLEDMANLVHKYSQPFFSHISETAQEVEECINRYGETPTQLFDRLNLFEYGGAGFHGVYLTDEDLECYQKKNITVVTNPASNLKLASGIADVSKMLERGINVALGTDGPASNNGLDMFKEMYLASVLQKYRLQDAAACSPENVLLMATKNSALCMGLDNCDCLAPGKYADIIMIDLKKPNMQPENKIINSLVYSANPGNIKMTMINGAIKYFNGKLYIDDDIDEVYERGKMIVKALS